MAAQSPTLSLLAAKVESLAQEVECHNEWINGNGKPGAKEVLGNLNTRLASIEKSMDALNGRITGLIVTIIGGGIGWFLFSVLPNLLVEK